MMGNFPAPQPIQAPTTPEKDYIPTSEE